MTTQFRDRTEAGQALATRLTAFANRPDVLVLALPRGGVPVAAEVAKRLNVLIDVFVVRKLGLPDQPELAMGAIATGGVRVTNRDVVDSLGILTSSLTPSLHRNKKNLRAASTLTATIFCRQR